VPVTTDWCPGKRVEQLAMAKKQEIREAQELSLLTPLFLLSSFFFLLFSLLSSLFPLFSRLVS